MKILNFQNIEESIFQHHEKLKKILPSYYSSYFEQWKLSKQLPMLRRMGQSALYDFLNHIRDEDISKLEDFFGEKIIVEKLNYNIVENFKISIKEDDICQLLCGLTGYNYFTTWRDNDFLYISFWR